MRYLLILDGSLGTCVFYINSLKKFLDLHQLDSVNDLDLYFDDWDCVSLFEIKRQIL